MRVGRSRSAASSATDAANPFTVTFIARSSRVSQSSMLPAVLTGVDRHTSSRPSPINDDKWEMVRPDESSNFTLSTASNTFSKNGCTAAGVEPWDSICSSTGLDTK